MNYFYGSLHFVVTIGARHLPLRRAGATTTPSGANTLAIATALALIGFRFWPLMPPRLLSDSYGYVDTLARYPTFWSFNSGAVAKISNQYAAMPSVHCAWALFCACVFVPRVRSTWAKVLAGFYPLATVTVIVLTANHYFLDAVGGFTILGIGYVASRLVTRAGRGPALAHTDGGPPHDGGDGAAPEGHAPWGPSGPAAATAGGDGARTRAIRRRRRRRPRGPALRRQRSSAGGSATRGSGR